MSAGRLAAAGMVLAVCALFGRVRASGNESALRETHALCGDIMRLETLLRSQKLTLPEAAERLSREGASRELWEGVSQRMSEGMSFSGAFSAAPHPALCLGAAEAVCELAEGLGKADMAAELSRLKNAEARLSSICDEAEKAGRNRDKLTTSLSMLCGLAAALLIL